LARQLEDHLSLSLSQQSVCESSVIRQQVLCGGGGKGKKEEGGGGVKSAVVVVVQSSHGWRPIKWKLMKRVVWSVLREFDRGNIGKKRKNRQTHLQFQVWFERAIARLNLTEQLSLDEVTIRVG
jgi:hypothetical protein